LPLIGFDAHAVRGKLTGLGVYTRELLAAIKSEISSPLEFRELCPARARPRDMNTLERLDWENRGLPALAKANKVDLLHVPAFAPPLVKPCRLLVTVHDIAGKLFPNHLGKVSAFYWGRWLPFAASRADLIMTISEYTKKDLVSHLKVDEGKVRVVYPSGHERFSNAVSGDTIAETQKRLGIAGRYFLFVGTMEPRKNLGRILEAFKLFCRESRGHQLVLVGSKGFAHGKYARSLEILYGLDSGAVHAPGFLPHEDLNALYCGAEALVFPSLYEGFGIPILEAMASGCPVITSDTTSTPEAAGEAALFVDPLDAVAIAAAMSKISSDTSLREALKQKGFAQIQNFSWRTSALQTIALYKELLGICR
jgi:glycosyltransferase involved in cell wall biosynthesis